jgi:hypothetical protein
MTVRCPPGSVSRPQAITRLNFLARRSSSRAKVESELQCWTIVFHFGRRSGSPTGARPAGTAVVALPRPCTPCGGGTASAAMKAPMNKPPSERSGLTPSWKIVLPAIAALVAVFLGLARALESTPEPITFFGNDQIVASVATVAVAPVATSAKSASSLGGAVKLVALGTSLLGIATLLRRTS